jgi:cytochrome c oxidase assembly factor CtaG
VHPAPSPPIVWSPELSVLIGSVAMSAVYVLGWRRARGPGQPHPPGFGRLALFAASQLSLLGALVSPIDSLSDRLIVVHMVQHLLLLDALPIFLILSLTKGIMRPVTRRVTKLERRAGMLASPWFALLLYVAIMFLWHTPLMYDAALAHNGVHVLEHVCFITAGSLYWWQVLSPIKPRLRLAGMGPVAYMVLTKLTVGFLGVVLAFAPGSFYGFYTHQPHWWGLTPQVDQSLAGLVMALEQSVVMGIALVYLFVKMIDESEKKARQAERVQAA